MSELIDFGKNTFAYTIGFNFPFVSRSQMNSLWRSYLEKDARAQGSYDQTRQEVLISPTKVMPFSQLRLSSSRLTIWSGWQTPLDTWIGYRNEMLDLIYDVVEIAHSSLLLGIMAETTLAIPSEKLNEESPPYKDYAELLAKYMPTANSTLERYSTAFSGEAGTTEVWFAGDPIEAETNITIRHMMQNFSSGEMFSRNLKNHPAVADEVLRSINRSLLEKIVR